MSRPFPEQRTLQLIFPGFRFGVDDAGEAERLTDMGVGGFCLYGGEASEVAAFTRRLQERASVPLLFCADYEDGAGSHVSGATRFPSNMGIGASGRAELARRKAQLTAVEARALGVRWVLAPVLDLATRADNPIVNVRSFGSDAALVSKMGRAYMKGLADGGVLSCAKHFPGHGDTRRDSHLELPVLSLTRRQLLQRDLIPFQKTRSAADSVMVAHLLVPALGDAAKTPASLSKDAIGFLRKELKFTRLVATDALSMRAVADSYDDVGASRAALSAGVDVLLVPADARRLAEALPALVQKDKALRRLVSTAHRRLLRAKTACGLLRDKGMPPAGDLKRVGCPAHRAEAERMAAAALTWIRKGTMLSGKRRLTYVEPDADAPGDWQGKAFVEELESFGIEVRPTPPSSDREPVVVASFLRPRAYSGRIGFSGEEARRMERAVSKQEESFLVSFGSPFVFDQFGGWRTGLCAFTDTDAAQRAAAWALMGRLEVGGSMPVPVHALARPVPSGWSGGSRSYGSGSKPAVN